MAKVYDYKGIVSALVTASQEWIKQGRVTRKTYLRLRGLMSQAVVNRMTGQLLDYQNPMSTQKPVDSVLDLPAWRKAFTWASKNLPTTPTVGGPYLEPKPGLDIGFTLDPEKLRLRIAQQERDLGL